MENTTVLYSKADRGLTIALNQTIKEYFASIDKKQFADRPMVFKIVFGLGSWLGFYLLMISGWFSGPLLCLMALLHGLTHLFIAFNISHDANHGALSSSRKMNNLLSYSLDLIGVSSYLWKIAHNQEHHSFVNITPIDPSIQGYGILRFTPFEKLKRAFRFQHIYSIFFYGLSTFNYVTFKDLKLLIKSMREGDKMPTKTLIITVLFKLFYYTYTIVLPIVLLDLSFGVVFLAFFILHFINGQILTFVFQCGHLTEEAHYPEVEDGKVTDSWVVHIIKTTGDFAPKNKLLIWLVGGINLHVIHHLYPTICHIHYKGLTPHLKKTVAAHGLDYREIPTFTQAIGSHIALLKQLGAENKEMADGNYSKKSSLIF